MCPWCQQEDDREPSDEIPLVGDGINVIYYDTGVSHEQPDVIALAGEVIESRWKTVDTLRDIAQKIADHRKGANIAKIVGTSVGITGFIVSVVGAGLTATLILAPAGM